MIVESLDVVRYNVGFCNVKVRTNWKDRYWQRIIMNLLSIALQTYIQGYLFAMRSPSFARLRPISHNSLNSLYRKERN
jgi:hypothetical protein